MKYSILSDDLFDDQLETKGACAGISVFRFDAEDEGRDHAFKYHDIVAVAALIEQGYNPVRAAFLVDQELVQATPHDPITGSDPASVIDPEGCLVVGHYQLSDASLWAVFADMGIRTRGDDEIPSDRQYHVLACRSRIITDEAPEERVRHMLTRIDKLAA